MARKRNEKRFGKFKHIHMIGIGGIGMSSIAEVLVGRGFTVSGSDLKKSEVTDHLEQKGIKVYEGHAAENLAESVDVIVFSSAVKGKEKDNPEIQEADRRRIPLIGRPEMLAELMRMQFGIGIAGTHGKTTTTTMTGLVVGAGDYDPTIIVGGKVAVFGSNAVFGTGDVIIIEADEYDRTFLRLTPILAVITNVEWDHSDIYPTFDDAKQAFTQYANSVPFFGAAIMCLDDPGVQSILPDISRRVVTYGLSRQASIRAEEVHAEGNAMRFNVVKDGEHLGEVHLQAPGLHNVRNALAAIAVGIELDMSIAKIIEGLKKFNGVNRRFEVKGDVNNILVVDDYAHHPTEIQAVLDAVTHGWKDRRVIVVFQPHLYSRTRDFMEEFSRSFFNADVVVLTDIFGAREEPMEGITTERLVELAKHNGHREVHHVPNKDDIPDYLLQLAQPNDIVITVGAGDIWRRGEAFVEKLKKAQ